MWEYKGNCKSASIKDAFELIDQSMSKFSDIDFNEIKKIVATMMVVDVFVNVEPTERQSSLENLLGYIKNTIGFDVDNLADLLKTEVQTIVDPATFRGEKRKADIPTV